MGIKHHDQKQLGTLKESEKPLIDFVVNRNSVCVHVLCPQHFYFSENNSRGKFKVKGTYQKQESVKSTYVTIITTYEQPVNILRSFLLLI